MSESGLNLLLGLVDNCIGIDAGLREH